MYQREWFQGKQVERKFYKPMLRKCARSWERLPEEQKDAFSAKALYEEDLRREAALQPLPSKCGVKALGSAAFDAAADLCKNARKKVSLSRLVETYRHYAGSEMWRSAGMALACADGCLHLDALDLEKTGHEIEKDMTAALHNPGPAPVGVDLGDMDGNLPGMHHGTCRQTIGHCKQKPHTALAKKFVMNFNQFLTRGVSANPWFLNTSANGGVESLSWDMI